MGNGEEYKFFIFSDYANALLRLDIVARQQVISICYNSGQSILSNWPLDRRQARSRQNVR
jgi:hypothetical protein